MNHRHSSLHGAGSSYEVPLYDTTALTSALTNPYAQHYAPHYYQAYMQAHSNGPSHTTKDGYTLSSTYVPGMDRATSSRPIPSPQHQTHPQTPVKPILNHLTYGSWYQPGNCQCTRQGCPFTGSRKSVEIHMMDRHFILPPGWVKKNDWDADPSLRGKPIAIQGTSLLLDTPEAINAWVAERKRRFPTDSKIQEKKRKLEEATARGQLTPEDIGVGARKRYRQNTTLVEGSSKGLREQRYQSRGRQGWVRREEPRTTSASDSLSQPADANTNCAQETSPIPGPILDDDEAPEVVSSKAPTPRPRISNVDIGRSSAVQVSPAPTRRIIQPKKPPRNPFASRSTLLRNLLLPEIRITASNLSQAIHFLVQNDLLRNVELWPGEAQERMIEVIEVSETRYPDPEPSTGM